MFDQWGAQTCSSRFFIFKLQAGMEGLVHWFCGMRRKQNQIIWPFQEFTGHKEAMPPGDIRHNF